MIHSAFYVERLVCFLSRDIVMLFGRKFIAIEISVWKCMARQFWRWRYLFCLVLHLIRKHFRGHQNLSRCFKTLSFANKIELLVPYSIIWLWISLTSFHSIKHIYSVGCSIHCHAYTIYIHIHRHTKNGWYFFLFL